MPSKTFKIGEYCKGGIITVEVNGVEITVIGKEWDNSKGYSRMSDQSNAKEFIRGNILANAHSVRWQLTQFIGDLTTSYYTEKIIEWIESKVSLSRYD